MSSSLVQFSSHAILAAAHRVLRRRNIMGADGVESISLVQNTIDMHEFPDESMPLRPSAVWSCNEWDPLREVIVGTARGAAEPAYEPAFAPFLHAGDPGRKFAGARIMSELVDEAERQLDAFAQLLADRGIVVRRPDPVDHAVPVKTPDWEARSAARAPARAICFWLSATRSSKRRWRRPRAFSNNAAIRLCSPYTLRPALGGP